MFQNNAIFYLKNQKNPQENPVFYQKNCAVLKGHSSAVLCQKYTKFIHTQQKSNQHSHSFLRGYVASADIRCVHRMKDSFYEILFIKYRRYVAFIGSRALCKLGVGLFANCVLGSSRIFGVGLFAKSYQKLTDIVVKGNLYSSNRATFWEEGMWTVQILGIGLYASSYQNLIWKEPYILSKETCVQSTVPLFATQACCRYWV